MARRVPHEQAFLVTQFGEHGEKHGCKHVDGGAEVPRAGNLNCGRHTEQETEIRA